jgi:hypothetical protein
MKLAIPLALSFLVTACMHEVTATSYAQLPETDSQVVLQGSLAQVEWIVVEKLANRGFALVDKQKQGTGMMLKFAGNRDFWMTQTLGSVFYAWIEPVSPQSARLRMEGKPTIGHREGCPSLDGSVCTPLMTNGHWGLTGAEEATAIHGVLAELEVDGVVGSGSDARTAAITKP